MRGLQGEYIAPEKIENVVQRSPFVAQAFVYGDSLRSQLVSVVVADHETLLPWAAERGLPQDFAQLCEDPLVPPPRLHVISKQSLWLLSCDDPIMTQ